MTNYKAVAIVLLGLSTIANGVTAVELVRIARNGMSVELTLPEAKDMIDTYEAAINDMEAEEGEGDE